MQGFWEVSGEIDMMTAPALGAGMRAAIDEAGERDVFVDCTEVTFMDSSAFYALVDANRYAVERDRRLVIRGLQPNCSRVISLCDWANELVFEDTSS